MGHVAQGVIEGPYLFLIELGLLLERKGLDDPRLRYPGFWEPELAEVLAFDPAFLFHDMGEQSAVGEALIARQREIVLPMLAPAAQVQVFEFGG